MYKKLLNENTKNFGGVNSFVLSLRKEVTFWKFAFAVLSIIIIFAYFSNQTNGGLLNKLKKGENEPITAKEVKYLTHDVIAEIRFNEVIMPDIEVEKLLDEIEKSKKIKGLLVVIDTPGGSPNASELIYQKLKKIGSKIPVITFIESYGTSGGYMIAIAGQKIVAMKTSTVGSIGVISGGFDYTELMKKVGIGYHEYATSEYKGAGSPFKKTTEEQMKYRQDILMQIFEVFRSMVKEERGFTNAELSRVDNAKIFIGQKALDLKLVDYIGDKETALSMITEELKKDKLENIPVQEIQKEQKRQADFLNITSQIMNFIMYIKTAIIK